MTQGKLVGHKGRQGQVTERMGKRMSQRLDASTLTHSDADSFADGIGDAPLLAKGSFIGQYFPGFFFGNRHRNHRHHARTGDAVFQNPEQLAVRPSFVKPAIGQITRTGIQAPAYGTISQSGFSMARDADAFTFIQALSFCKNFR